MPRRKNRVKTIERDMWDEARPDNPLNFLSYGIFEQPEAFLRFIRGAATVEVRQITGTDLPFRGDPSPEQMEVLNTLLTEAENITIVKDAKVEGVIRMIERWSGLCFAYQQEGAIEGTLYCNVPPWVWPPLDAIERAYVRTPFKTTTPVNGVTAQIYVGRDDTGSLLPLPRAAETCGTDPGKTWANAVRWKEITS